MDIYQKKERIVLSRTTRKRRRHIEVDFESSDAIRSEFFDRYVSSAFINYSKVIDSAKKQKKTVLPELSTGFLEKLKQMRCNEHTRRVNTAYIGEYLEKITAESADSTTLSFI